MNKSHGLILAPTSALLTPGTLGIVQRDVVVGYAFVEAPADRSRPLQRWALGTDYVQPSLERTTLRWAKVQYDSVARWAEFAREYKLGSYVKAGFNAYPDIPLWLPLFPAPPPGEPLAQIDGYASILLDERAVGHVLTIHDPAPNRRYELWVLSANHTPPVEGRSVDLAAPTFGSRTMTEFLREMRAQWDDGWVFSPTCCSIYDSVPATDP